MKTPKTHAKQIDRAAVEAKAKQIMDNFLAALADAPEPKGFGLRRTGTKAQLRDAAPCESSAQFRPALFANAPLVKDDELVMERKKW